jgi:hypothetical protein
MEIGLCLCLDPGLETNPHRRCGVLRKHKIRSRGQAHFEVRQVDIPRTELPFRWRSAEAILRNVDLEFFGLDP